MAQARLTHSDSDEREHVLSADCWCNPTVEKIEPARARATGVDADPDSYKREFRGENGVAPQ